MKGDLIYTDGKLKVVIKRRYAYYYNLKGIPYGRVEVDSYFFTLLDQAGFKRIDQEEQCKHDRLYKSVVGSWYHCRDCGNYWQKDMKERQQEILEEIVVPDLKS